MTQRILQLERQVEVCNDALEKHKIEQEAVEKSLNINADGQRRNMEVLDKFSAKTIQFAAYSLSGVALVLSVMNIALAYRIGTTYKDTRRIISRARTRAEQEFTRHCGIYENSLKKMKGEIDQLTEQLMVAMDSKRRILDRLMTEVGKRIGQEFPKKDDIFKILDDTFRHERHMHEIESYRADLKNADKSARERAVLAIEAMGMEKWGRERTIRVLTQVVEDRMEDPEIRLQAQRSIEIVKCRATPTLNRGKGNAVQARGPSGCTGKA